MEVRDRKEKKYQRKGNAGKEIENAKNGTGEPEMPSYGDGSVCP
jgi:hypothetical protein